MEKEMRRAREIYIMLALQEREGFIIKKETDRVRPILNSMALPERGEWLKGPEFARRVERAKNRDRVWQSLVNGELCLTEQADEIEALAPLIMSELKAGRKPELDFLRSVRRFRLSPEQAHRAIDLLNDDTVNGWLTGKKGSLLRETSIKLEQYLKNGEMARWLPARDKKDLRDDGVPVLDALTNGRFARGMPQAAAVLAFQPGTPQEYIKKRIYEEFPELRICAKAAYGAEQTVASALSARIGQTAGPLLAAARKAFKAQRVRSLLAVNPSVIRLQKEADEAKEKARRLRMALLSAVPEHYRDLYPLARAAKRRFFLHIGPTNSGKTYEGVQRLHGALNGVYLGPLRLLAAEQFEALNLDGVPCTLVTGEEQIRVPGSRVQSSTVEMADLKAHYDVAVIDECQMIADPSRGGAWSAAILGLCADEIHACASPDAESLLTRIISDCGDELTVVRHERMTPLEVEREGFQFPASVRPGDALIVFSKARVHAVAAELKSKGHRVSLIYGALPPDVRRNQAERFHRGETDVVVSTDAIAMGMNLPIQRVVFLESEKYDGDIVRPLNDSEIRQIAGRAGRYGIYEIGYVNALGFRQRIEQALTRSMPQLTEAVIRFPESLLGIPLPLTEIINRWLNMQDRDGFHKASATRMAALAAMLETRRTDKELLYSFICIPFDETDPDLLNRWKTLYHSEFAGDHAEVLPELPEMRDPEECTVNMLDGLEADYRRCDLYYNYARLFLEDPDDLLDEIQRRKDLISQGIVHILSTQKLRQHTCPGCGRSLPWDWPFPFCDYCHNKQSFRPVRSGGRRRRR